ncbi:MAG TPA: glycosyl transferase family 1 [Thermotoga sp.]|uniref:mannosylglucosylglycerate synthase n=1 Tax=Thermotoga sp. (strain RQ2) TaxID=126740 RepID=UPI0001600B8B|nr:mannosylglucosylglycerate synthase [Thermotoga sp. RQ2]ACB09924.1 glycosyl transferase group 1 [Thermotoga sp. RQ2]HBF69980.1 glycosyl transferase family 1 [Thermotoga sp.]
MKIALIHYRGGLMDGVSLEMEKWKKVLTKMGHEVHIVAENKKEGVDLTLKEIGFENPDFERVNRNFFGGIKDFLSEKEFLDFLKEKEEELFHILNEALKNYDLIVPNNIWSLGLFPPLGLALSRLEKNFVAHHHDFWWERKHLIPENRRFREILEKHFPPDLPNVKHVVINTIAQRELKRRRNIDSVVVPNVMDFSSPITSEEMYHRVREELQIAPGTIVALQATRIDRRKAIELSIDVVSLLKETLTSKKEADLYNGERYSGEVILLFSGICEDEEYLKELKEYASSKGVSLLVLSEEVRKNTSLFWKLYNAADFVTYPSILEGWGNQLLEAIAAKKPVVLFEYEVFKSDIKPAGLKYVSLGDRCFRENGLVKVDERILKKAVEEISRLLFDPSLYRETVEHNFEVGKRHFSLERLEDILSREVLP